MGNIFSTSTVINNSQVAKQEAKQEAPFYALSSINDQHEFYTPSEAITDLHDVMTKTPKQAAFYCKLPELQYQTEQNNVSAFVLDRKICDVGTKLTMVGSLKHIEKIEVCLRPSNAYDKTTIADECTLIETVHAHQIHFLLNTTDEKHCILPVFINRLKQLFVCNAIYSLIVIRIYSPLASNVEYSLAMHGYTLAPSARRVTNRAPVDNLFEHSEFVGSFKLENQEINKFSVNTKEASYVSKFKYITSLVISVFNKTKGQYEIDCVDECALHLDDVCVYACFNYEDIVHTQLAMFPSSTIKKHILIPFSSTLLQSPPKVSGMIDFSKLDNVYITLKLKQQYVEDLENEYECFISITKLATLHCSGGYFKIKEH